MDNPTQRSIPDLARDAAAISDQLGAGLEVAGWVGGEWFSGGAGAVLRPGSVTKLVTATATMQCVDDGMLALGDPVARWVPHIRGDVTIAHLLSHSSGIDAGDVFVDTGEDDDCLVRYLDLLDGAGQIFEPGQTCSYNNAGMVLAGHIVALLRGMTYEEAMQTFVFDRAEMAGAGFELERNGNPICSRSLAPAGGSMVCTAADLIRLAVSPDLVKPDTAALMRTLHVPAPGGVRQNCGFGLGWQVWRNELGETARHSGAYPGKAATLVHDHANDAAVAFMSPFGTGINAITPMLDDRGAVAVDVPATDLDLYVGRFRSQGMNVAIDHRTEGEGLQLTLESYPAMPIEHVDRGAFTLVGEPFAFFDFDERGAPRFMRFRMRVLRRLA